MSQRVKPEQLEVGAVYFISGCVDRDMLVPFVQPMVFIGRNLAAGDDADDRRWYFQDYESYRDGVRHHGGSGDRADAEFVVYPTDGDLSVHDLETVIARLGECLSRSRRGQS